MTCSTCAYTMTYTTESCPRCGSSLRDPLSAATPGPTPPPSSDFAAYSNIDERTVARGRMGADGGGAPMQAPLAPYAQPPAGSFPPPAAGYPPAQPFPPYGQQQGSFSSTIDRFGQAEQGVGGQAASYGARVGAFLLDAVILYVGVVLLQLVVRNTLGGSVNPFVPLLLNVVVYVGYMGTLNGMGATLGKKALGLRVVDATTGAPIGFGRAAGRYLVFGLGGSIIVGLFSPLFDKSGHLQGWHDKAVNSRVIKSSSTMTREM